MVTWHGTVSSLCQYLSVVIHFWKLTFPSLTFLYPTDICYL